MKQVKVDATTSTNDTAKSLHKNGFGENFCISAEYQSLGKGQRQNIWLSEKSKNLMFTVVLGNLKLPVEQRFYLNMLVCNVLLEVLKSYRLNAIQLKWPNDILSEQKKIGGILIENTLAGHFITTTYIGIGLNVNQEKFNDLPKASSMKLLLQLEMDRQTILNTLLDTLEKIPKHLKMKSYDSDAIAYKNSLFGYNTTTQFILNQNKVSGKIRNVHASGEIEVVFEDGTVQIFNHSEIKQLY